LLGNVGRIIVGPEESGFGCGTPAGDVDDDGADDLLVRALGFDPNGLTSAGSLFVVSAAP
jgi:hypothetical protein